MAASTVTAAHHDQPNALLAALRYAELGLRVIPIRPASKAPMLGDWPNRASTDPQTIRQWWQTRPDAGVGIVMGPQPNGTTLVCVDVDNHQPGALGADTIRDLEDAYHPLPDTWEATTGSGGQHLVFRVPGGLDIRNDAGRLLGPGVDIRGAGGQIVVEPTLHPNGRPYCWDDGAAPWDRPVADAPGWLVALLTVDRDTQPVEPPQAAYNGPERPGDRWAQTITWAELLEPDGAQCLGTTRAGVTLWARPGINGDHTSATTGHVANCLHVFSTGWPSLPAGNHTKLGYLAHTRHGGDLGAATRWLVAQGHGTPPDDATGLIDPDWQQPLEQLEPPGHTGRMWQHLIWGDDITCLPAVEWLIPGVLQANSLAALYGPPKTFKTFAAIDLAMHLANRPHWRNTPIPRPARTLYVAAEGAPGVGPRAQAWCDHHHGTMNTFGWITVAPDLYTDPWEAQQLAAICAAHNIDLVIVDTLARSIPGAEENSAKDLGLVIRHLDLIRQHSGATVMVVHHMGKTDSNGMRGSSALRGAIDTGLELRGDNTSIRMLIADQKNAESGREYWWRPTRTGGSIVLDPADRPGPNDPRVTQLNCLRQLHQLGGSATDSAWKNQCAVMLELGRTLYERHRAELLAAGEVTMDQTRRGVSAPITWQLTPRGIGALEAMD